MFWQHFDILASAEIGSINSLPENRKMYVLFIVQIIG